MRLVCQLNCTITYRGFNMRIELNWISFLHDIHYILGRTNSTSKLIISSNIFVLPIMIWSILKSIQIYQPSTLCYLLKILSLENSLWVGVHLTLDLWNHLWLGFQSEPRVANSFLEFSFFHGEKIPSWMSLHLYPSLEL